MRECSDPGCSWLPFPVSLVCLRQSSAAALLLVVFVFIVIVIVLALAAAVVVFSLEYGCNTRCGRQRADRT